MCKSNLSMAVVVMAASLSNLIAPARADEGEWVTAGGSKPLSTSDIMDVKIERKGEGNELTTARVAKPIPHTLDFPSRERDAKPRRDATLSTADAKNLGVSPDRERLSRKAPSIGISGESKSGTDVTLDARGSRKIARYDAAFTTATAKDMDCDPRMHLAERNQKPSVGISSEQKSGAMESKPYSTGETPGIMIEGELGGNEIGKPLSKPEPNPWSRIAPSETHVNHMQINGWTIFSVVAGEESVIDVLVYDEDWNVLAQFDSTGCGAFLQAKPQMVTVMIHNTSRLVSNEYLLNVFDVN